MDDSIHLWGSRVFCPSCSGYFPSGAVCPHCGQPRAPLATPSAPGAPNWRAQVPGSIATQLTLAKIDGKRALIVPWGYGTHKGDTRKQDGGITALDLADGSVIWEKSVGTPIEGGAAVSELERVIVVGTASGILAGEGTLVALDLQTGELRFPPTTLGGAVRGAPAVDNTRVYVAAGDGKLYCLDARDGSPVWHDPVKVFDQPTPIPASPVTVREHGVTTAVVVATYGDTFGRVEGKVVALDPTGTPHWSKDAGGNVRGAPTLVDASLFVTAYRNNPSVGLVAAYHARTGIPLWKEPFTVQGQVGGHSSNNLVASPLVHGGIVYVGALNHRLYALDAKTGGLLWDHEVGGGIATAPAWIEGLVVFGANDGKVYAVDPVARETAWSFALDAPVRTNPLVAGETIFVGAENGAVVALPWHLGRYDWAAARLEGAVRFSEAGDCRALAAHFSRQPQAQLEFSSRAEEDWNKADEPEKAAETWLALDQLKSTADAFKRAGESWRNRDRQRAASYFKRAADLYFDLRDSMSLIESTRALARCASLPFVRLETLNVPEFVQWEPGEFTLRLFNEGTSPIPKGVKLFLGGALKNWVQVEIHSEFQSGARWNIPLTVTATRRESVIEVELEYDSGMSRYTPMRELLRIKIEAVEPRTPPPNITIGDVATLKIETRTEEGLAITTHDVGMIRSSGSIDRVNAEGDVGSITSGSNMGDVHVGNSTGLPAKPLYSEALSEIREMLQELLAGQEQLVTGLVAIYRRQDASSQQVIRAVMEALDKQQIRRDEIEAMLAPIQSALTAIRERGVQLDDETLRQHIMELGSVLDSQASVDHKFKVSIPILPWLVNYEAELALGGQADLAGVWERLKSRFGGKTK